MTDVERADQGLTITEAARQLGVHYHTVRAWMAKFDQNHDDPAGLPYTQFGAARPGTRRIVKIHPDDLARFRGRAGS